MNVLDLAQEAGLHPKRSAGTKGGEYHSACPNPVCGGQDRFCIWPKQGDSGRYWCRQCQKHGDAIQFCRDFLGLSFVDARQKVNQQLASFGRYPSFLMKEHTPTERPSKNRNIDFEKWSSKAGDFSSSSQSRLYVSQEGLEELRRRGISDQSIVAWRLGFNPIERFDCLADWGLPYEVNDKGNTKKIWLPRGLVIPYREQGTVKKIRIRRLEADNQKKYILVPGSSDIFSWYGEKTCELPIVLVESDLDAILLWQEAGDVCLPVALGSSCTRPDAECSAMLRRAPLILYSLDWDQAGKKAFEYWHTYSQIKPWPSALGKSPGDDFLEGIDLKSWISLGICSA